MAGFPVHKPKSPAIRAGGCVSGGVDGGDGVGSWRGLLAAGKEGETEAGVL